VHFVANTVSFEPVIEAKYARSSYFDVIEAPARSVCVRRRSVRREKSMKSTISDKSADQKAQTSKAKRKKALAKSIVAKRAQRKKLQLESNCAVDDDVASCSVLLALKSEQKSGPNCTTTADAAAEGILTTQTTQAYCKGALMTAVRKQIHPCQKRESGGATSIDFDEPAATSIETANEYGTAGSKCISSFSPRKLPVTSLPVTKFSLAEHCKLLVVNKLNLNHLNLSESEGNAMRRQASLSVLCPALSYRRRAAVLEVCQVIQ